MRKTLTYVVTIVTLFALSCSKKNDASPGDSSSLVGNYNFLYMSAATSSTSSESAAGQSVKTITYTNYKTTDNTGTVSFTKDSASTSNLGYTASTNAMSYVYENNVLTDSIEMPFDEVVPPTSSITKYDVFGKDSIYMHQGLMSGLSTGTTATYPSGGRYSFKGDTLFITMKFSQNLPNQSSGGVTVSSSVSINATIAMKKQ